MESDRRCVPGVLVGDPQEWARGCGHSCDCLQQKGSRLLAAEGRGTWGGVQGSGLQGPLLVEPHGIHTAPSSGAETTRGKC